jgi:hypothetical protein
MSNRLVITAYVPSTESVHQGLCQIAGLASEFRAYEWQGASQTLLILAFLGVAAAPARYVFTIARA